MATNRHPIRHPRRSELTHAQDMVLQYGASDRWADAFRDESEHRDAWIRNRDRLLAWYRHARRPQAWWQFEAPIPDPGYEREQSALYAAGLLGEDERAELVAWWREQFEKAQAPDFWLCLGPGRFLKDEPARRAQYREADIPRALLSQWTARHRRRSNTIRKLQETAAVAPDASLDAPESTAHLTAHPGNEPAA
jgi:hypothetical protein